MGRLIGVQNYTVLGPGPSEPGGRTHSLISPSAGKHIEHPSCAGFPEVGWARPGRFQKEPGGGEQTLWHMSAQ